jgi:hypothetical protein
MDFDAHNRQVEAILDSFEGAWFADEVEFYMKGLRLSRFEAEKRVLEFRQRKMKPLIAKQKRREAQENGTFGTVEAQPQPAPIRAALPAKVEEIPEDFGLPDKEYITGEQICALAKKYGLCSRATIQGDMRAAAGRAKPKRGQRSAADPDHGKPYIFDRAKAIEILLNRLDRIGQKAV